MLIFLYNELMEEQYRRALGLDMKFISFGYIRDAKLYQLDVDNVIAVNYNDIKGGDGNNKVYGAIFYLHEKEHKRLIDAYMISSCSVLGGNHIYDTTHYFEGIITPIRFNTLDELSRLLYNESPPVKCGYYLGNINKSQIKNRLIQSRNRLTSGLLEHSIFSLFLEEG